MVYVGKGTYYGYWENNLRNGEGVMTYVNQDVYSGNWKDGQKHGQGTYVFFETGMKFVGKWSSGQISQGEWKYPNGTKFTGKFDNNKPKGKGKWQFENGNVVEGEYGQTKRADVDVGDDIRLAWKTTSDITKAPSE
jgi:radial spoke head protein 1